MNKTKPYAISKKVVYEAFLRAKAKKGSAGIDEESIDAFELNIKDNLYKLWNRMSSGSYFPPATPSLEAYPPMSQRVVALSFLRHAYPRGGCQFCYRDRLAPFCLSNLVLRTYLKS